MADEKKDDGTEGKDGKKADEPDAGKTPEKETKPDPDKQFSQADVDRILSERLEREREKSKRDTEEAKRKATEAALEQNKEFEKLATERKAALEAVSAKAAELEPKVEALTKRAEAAEAAVAEFVKAEVEALKLSEALQDAIKDKAPVDRLRWLTKHRAELAKSNGNGVPGSPDADTGAKKLSDEERRKLTRPAW